MHIYIYMCIAYLGLAQPELPVDVQQLFHLLLCEKSDALGVQHTLRRKRKTLRKSDMRDSAPLYLQHSLALP